MAAVVERSNWCKLLLAIVLFTSLSFPAGLVTDDTTTRLTHLELSGADAVIEANLTYLTLEANIEHQTDVLTEIFKLSQSGDQEGAEALATDSGLEDFLGEIESRSAPLAYVELKFYYIVHEGFDIYGDPLYQKIPVPDCEVMETDENGIAVCPVYDEVFEGTCREIVVAFGDEVYGAQLEDGDYQYTQESIQVCDEKTTALGVMRDAVKTTLAANTENPLCLVSMLLGGMLLGSMFFAGRNPLALLDLTTPLLPKAKSISYSGLRMGAGFGRMVGEMGAMGGDKGLIANAAKATTRDLLRYIRKKGGYNQHLINRILDSDANSVVKMMALRALAGGKGRQFIDRILGLKGGVNDENFLREYGKILSELNRLDDAAALDKKKQLHFRVINFSQMNMLNMTQQDAFAGATGQVPAWLKNALTFKYLGPFAPGKLPFLGTHIMGGTASLFFGGRHIGRMYNSVARGAVRVIGDAVSRKKFTKKIQMSVDNAKRKGKKPGRIYKWIALSDEERQMVKVYDNFEYGEALYKRLMKEAQRDVLNWLLGSTLAHFLRRGKLNLNQEEMMKIGRVKRDANGNILWRGTPEELMFADFDEAGFRDVETELRAILSDRRLDNIQKARAIMALLDARGVAYDRLGADAALNRLVQIDTTDPRDFDPNLTYSNRDAVLSAHKLVRLQEYLHGQFDVHKPIDLDAAYGGGRRFFFTVGRQTLAHGTSDYTFRTLFLNNYRNILEKPHRTRPIGFMEAANYSFLRVVNERWGLLDLDPKELKGKLNQELKDIMTLARGWLRSLADPTAFKGNASTASMTALMDALYSPSGRLEKERTVGKEGEPQDLAYLQEHGDEYAARKGAWLMDMHAHWRFGGHMGGAKTSVENQAFGEVNRAHNVPLAVQEMVNRAKARNQTLTTAEAMRRYREEIVVPSYLYTRLKGIMEQDNPNTYFTSQGEFNRFNALMSAYRARVARERGIAEAQVTDAMIERFIIDPKSLDDISTGTWVRLKEGSYAPFDQKHNFSLAQADRIVNGKFFIKRGGYWEEFAPEKFMTDHKRFRDFLHRDNKLNRMLFGQIDYTLSEGKIRGIKHDLMVEYKRIMDDLKRAGEAGRRPTITAADINRLVNQLAAEGHDKARHKKVEACAAMVSRLFYDYDIISLGVDRAALEATFGTAIGDKIRVERLLRNYKRAETDADRAAAADALKEWARQGTRGEERHVQLALFLYHNASSSGNWTDFNGYNEAIKMGPSATTVMREKGAGPVQEYEKVGGVKGFFKNVWNFAKNTADPIARNANLGLEQFLMSTFGRQMKYEYEGSLTSEYFRETGGRFLAKLAAGELGDLTDRNSTAMKAYNELADSFTRYHAVWDETITRDPRGNSSAIGSPWIYSSFFHHGPAMAFGPAFYRRWTYAGIDKPWTTWSGFKANVRERMWGLQWAPQMFNWAVGTPFGVAYRNYITSRWGFMTKYDRKYANAPTVAQAQVEYAGMDRATAALDYEQRKTAYDNRLNIRVNQLLTHHSREDAMAIAKNELDDIPNLKPSVPAFDLERDTLRPFAETMQRKSEGRAGMLNWFFASFDPNASNPKRFLATLAASPLTPIASFIPSRWVQSKVMKYGAPALNREDKNPFYVSPQNLRRGLMAWATGPMVKRQHGGTELVTGVTRSHEDTWAYQAGTNAVWGNANPGVSYVDFSRTLHLDPRAANYLRYESKYRPYMQYDEYVDRQSRLGLVKRDIDPFSLMMARNAEIRHYKFPDNTLFRFLSPATYFAYKGSAWMHKLSSTAHGATDLFRETATNVSATRGGRWHRLGTGLKHLSLRAEEKVANYVHRKVELGFRGLGFTGNVRYCRDCGGPMASGGACNACSRKVRCPDCRQVVNPSHNHSCSHGIQRNILTEDLSANRFIYTVKEKYKPWYQRRKENWGREV